MDKVIPQSVDLSYLDRISELTSVDRDLMRVAALAGEEKSLEKADLEKLGLSSEKQKIFMQLVRDWGRFRMTMGETQVPIHISNFRLGLQQNSIRLSPSNIPEVKSGHKDHVAAPDVFGIEVGLIKDGVAVSISDQRNYLGPDASMMTGMTWLLNADTDLVNYVAGRVGVGFHIGQIDSQNIWSLAFLTTAGVRVESQPLNIDDCMGDYNPQDAADQIGDIANRYLDPSRYIPDSSHIAGQVRNFVPSGIPNEVPSDVPSTPQTPSVPKVSDPQVDFNQMKDEIHQVAAHAATEARQVGECIVRETADTVDRSIDFELQAGLKLQYGINIGDILSIGPIFTAMVDLTEDGRKLLTTPSRWNQEFPIQFQAGLMVGIFN